MKKSIIYTLTLIIAILISLNPVYADYWDHKDDCSFCHTGMPHALGAANAAWAECGKSGCHPTEWGEVGASVHVVLEEYTPGRCTCHGVGHKARTEEGIYYGYELHTWWVNKTLKGTLKVTQINTTIGKAVRLYYWDVLLDKQPKVRQDICFNCHFDPVLGIGNPEGIPIELETMIEVEPRPPYELYVLIVAIISVVIGIIWRKRLYTKLFSLLHLPR